MGTFHAIEVGELTWSTGQKLGRGSAFASRRGVGSDPTRVEVLSALRKALAPVLLDHPLQVPHRLAQLAHRGDRQRPRDLAGDWSGTTHKRAGE